MSEQLPAAGYWVTLATVTETAVTLRTAPVLCFDDLCWEHDNFRTMVVLEGRAQSLDYPDRYAIWHPGATITVVTDGHTETVSERDAAEAQLLADLEGNRP